MKTKKYIIVDITENTGNPYINDFGDNVSDISQSRLYNSENSAKMAAMLMNPFSNWFRIKMIKK